MVGSLQLGAGSIAPRCWCAALVLILVVMAMPGFAQEEPAPVKPVPRVEIERPEFFVYEEGAVIAVIRGSEGSTRPDGRVLLKDAVIIVYRSAEKPAEGVPAGSSDSVEPRQVLILASAGVLVWTRGTSSMEATSDFWVSYLPKSPEKALLPGASSLPDDRHRDSGGVFLFSGVSATLSWSHKDNQGQFQLKEGRDVRVQGMDLRASAARMSVVALTTPLATDANQRRADLAAISLSEVESVTIRAPDGMDIVLPAELTFEALIPSAPAVLGGLHEQRTRVALVSDAELVVGKVLPNGDRPVDFTGSGGARVLAPGSESPILSATQLSAKAVIVEMAVADAKSGSPATEAKAAVTTKFVPLEVRLTGRASARLLSASGTANSIVTFFHRDGSYTLSFLGSPSIVGSTDLAEAKSGDASKLTASLSITAATSVSINVTETLWTVTCTDSVRALIGFQTGHSIGVAGDVLTLQLTPPASGDAVDEGARTSSRVLSFSRLSPKDVKSLVSEGQGVLPRVAFFERSTGDQPGARRVALFAARVEVRRLLGAFDIEATGEEVRMSLDLPLSASALVRGLLHPQQNDAGAISVGRSALGLAQIPSVYDVTAKQRLYSRIEGLGTGNISTEQPSSIEVRTSTDTTVDEYPQVGAIKGHVSAGPVRVLIRGMATSEAEKSAEGNPASLKLSLASFDYRPSQATGRVSIASASDIIDAAKLELNYSGKTVFADVRGPLVVAARGKDASKALVNLDALELMGESERRQANLSILRSPGDMRFDLGLDDQSDPATLTVHVTSAVSVENSVSSHISAATGKRALEEWDETRNNSVDALASFSFGDMRGAWRFSKSGNMEGVVETQSPCRAMFHESGASFSGGAIRMSDDSGAKIVTLSGRTDVVLTGVAARVLARGLTASREQSQRGPSPPRPGSVGENPVPPLPSGPLEGATNSDPAKRYPGGVVLTCIDGPMVFAHSTAARPMGGETSADDGFLSIVIEHRLKVTGKDAEGVVVDAMEADRLDAALWDTAVAGGDEYSRVRHLTLTGSVIVNAEGTELTGERMVFDPTTGQFRVEGGSVAVGLDDRATISGLHGITVVPGGAAAENKTDSPPRPTDPVGPRLRATGKRIVLRLKSKSEASTPPQPPKS